MGHIKLDRKILEWEWYADINTCRLFLHMLLKANWKDGKFQGIEVPRGSFISSYQNLADETSLTVKKVRTALEHLKETGEVAVKRHTKFSVFTVNNYCSYQSEGTVAGTRRALEGHSKGSQRAVDFGEKTENELENPENVAGLRADNETPRNAEYTRIIDDGETAEGRQEGSRRAVGGQSEGSQRATIEEVKNLRREEKEKTYARAFEELWKAYPRKSEKAAAYDKYKARLSDGYSEDELMTAVKRYADQCEKESTEQRYVKQAKTFFGARIPFADFLENQSIAVEKQEESDDRFASLTDAVRADLVEREVIVGESLHLRNATEEDITLLQEKGLL